MAVANPLLAASISVGSELAEVADRLRTITVCVRGPAGRSGAGVIWRPDGMIVTNAHVATSSQHTVELADGRVFHAELVRRDTRRDLAALRMAASGLRFGEIGDARTLRTGDVVLAVGNPMGAAGAFTVGMLACQMRPNDLFIRADIRLAPGNSGGPLANASGRVVGINTMIANGFGIAVSSNAVERFLADEGRTIGTTVKAVSVPVGDEMVLGLMVIELEVAAAAHISGVLIGDIIVRVNGEWLSSPEHLAEAVSNADRMLRLDVIRAGRLTSCEVVLRRERFVEVA